ncbi:PKD domain-containing protein [Jatrophihabitans endophyticus]|nr:PKD domain-containing protein [Jatrophihabitans endophyticus]
MAVAKGVLFVGGEFTSVRPPGSAAGSGEVARSYLAAFNATTGDLITSFNPQPNGKVWALKASPDGSRVYVGGDFTSIGGQTHKRLAAITVSSMSVVSAWKPDVSYRVEDIAQYGDSVYFVGPFGMVNTATRNKMAAVSASTAALLPWDPNADGDNPAAVAVSEDGSKVFVGGDFNTLQGQPERAFAAVDPTTGTPLAFPAQSAMPPVSSYCVSRVRNIVVKGDTVYASAAGDGGGCFDGTFAGNVNTGALVWRSNCLGATEAIQYVGNWLFKGSHAHDCSDQGDFGQNAGVGAANHFLLVQDPANGRIGPWFPTTNAAAPTNVGPLAFATDGTQVFVGGDFTTVNGAAQAHLTRFAATPETPPGKVQTPVAGVVGPNAVQVTFTAALDADDEDLTYNIYRQGTTAPIKTLTLNSKFWNIPSAQFVDTGLTPGSKVYYRVEATDGVGSTYSNWTSAVTVSASAPNYSTLVSADGASNYWKLDETSGTTAADSGNPAYRSTGTYSNVTLGQPSGTGGVGSASFNGSSSIVSTAQLFAGPSTFSEETWVKTTTNQGGKILGFGDSPTGTSSNYDRHLYMQNDGRVTFGVYSGGTWTVTSKAALNDGKWHQIVGTMVSGAMVLYVDGVAQGTAAATGSQTFRGYWRIGGDNINGWPGQPSSNFFNGLISDVATYPVVLSRTQVAKHYAAAGYAVAPTSSFTVDCTAKPCSFDASASDDVDGSITSYAWDFGDGKTVTTAGPTTTHDYATAGTYPVKLTVTDNSGTTDTSSQTATVRPQSPSDTYGSAVYKSNPSLYWRLDETAGSAAADAAGPGNGGTYYGSYTQGQPGALDGGNGTSVRFSGGGVYSNQAVANPTTYSEEAWFKTSTNVGGKIIGFGSSQVGGSGHYDRHVYMQNDGTLVFGAYNGSAATVTTATAYNDDTWHQVVATMGSGGMALYVDGQLIGTNSNTVSENFTGYWRVGNDTTWSSSSSAFNGSIDEVSVYPTALTAQDVSSHYAARNGSNEPPVASFTVNCTDLTCSFDGSASSDPDGSITSYAWDFGDGSSKTTTGPTVDHAYGSAGTRTVSLTVSDNRQATATVTKSAVATAPNSPPTASFALSCANLTCTFDGSGSTDSDGSVTAYAWNFGDGKSDTTSGAKVSHTFSSAGDYTVALQVVDDDGAVDSVSHTATATAPNSAPTARFTVTCTQRDCSFDGSTSADADGSVTGYAWNFGDGKTDTTSGATVTHSYASAGDYTVTLTVTDNGGATDTVTHTAAARETLASDAFDRTVTNGLGTADTGGAWKLGAGSASRYSVSGGAAKFQSLTAGAQTAQYLTGVSTTSADVVAGFTTDKAATGGGMYVSVEGRRVVGTGIYQAKVRLLAGGAVSIGLERVDANGTPTQIAAQTTIAGLTYTPGTVLRLRVQVTGTSPTSVRARVWNSSVAEPTAWQVTATDSTAGLQAAGTIGLAFISSGSSTNAPVVASFTNLSAVKPS